MAIDATLSGTTSNSFMSISDADALFTEIYGSDQWFNFSNDEKSTLLINSTNKLQTFIFSGLKAISHQALNFPRIAIFDYDGLPITGIPKKLKLATLLLAKWIWEESERNMTDAELQQFSNVKMGPLDFTPRGDAIIIPTEVNQMLSSIGPGILVTSNSYNKSSVSFCR